MSDAYRAAVVKDALHMYISLCDAVEKAGGNSAVVCSLEALSSMSALDLITHLCTNKIEFVYTGK